MGVKLTRAQVAQMLQVTPKTLAVWEKQGRVPEPERDWRGWRLYDEEAVATIRRVLNYTPASVPLVEQPLAPTQISARNRLAGVVRSVDGDGIRRSDGAGREAGRAGKSRAGVGELNDGIGTEVGDPHVV